MSEVSSDANQRPRFPRTLGELTDRGACPSCFVPYADAGPSCRSCGLTRDAAKLAPLLELSDQAGELLRERGTLLVALRDEEVAERQRADTARREGELQRLAEASSRSQARAERDSLAAHHAGQLDAASAALSSSRGPEPQRVRHPAPGAPVPHPAMQAPAMPPAAPAPIGPTAPRRSSVQLLLLILGISLLSIAAVVFLTFAWVVFGVEVKAAITAGITLGVIATASLLRRRRLSATAEGLGALGVVLVLLDVWAVQATGLFGADRVPGTLYWGVGLLGATVAFEAWHRLSRLRTPGIAASLTLLPGVGLAVAGVTADALGDAERLVLAATLAGAASAAHVLLRVKPDHANPSGSFSTAGPRSIERWVLVVAGLAALLTGSVTSAVQLLAGSDWLGHPICLVLITAIAVALGWLTSRERGALGSRTLLVSAGALAASSLAVVPLAFHPDLRLAIALAIAPLALAGALVLRARLPLEAPARHGTLGWSFATLGLAAVPVAILAIRSIPLAALAALAVGDRPTMASALQGATAVHWWALAGAALGLAGAVALLVATRSLTPWLTASVAGYTVFLALCAAANLPGAIPVTCGFAAVATATTAGVIRLSRARAATGQADARTGVALLAVGCSGAGLSIIGLALFGLTSPVLDVLSLVLTAALVFALRFARREVDSPIRTVLTVVAALTIVAIPPVSTQLGDAAASRSSDFAGVLAAAEFLGAALLLVLALQVPSTWLSRAERTAVGYVAAVPGVLASFALIILLLDSARDRSPGLTTDDPLWMLAGALALALTLAIVAAVWRRHRAGPRAESAPILALSAVALWAALATLATALIPSPELQAAVAALGVGAGALALAASLAARLRGLDAARLAPAEVSAGAVTVLSLGITWSSSAILGYPASEQFPAGVLALAGISAVLVAISPAGLFAARGRAFIGWVGVAALTVAWHLLAVATSGLAGSDARWLIGGIPLVGAALLLWRFGRARSEQRPARASAGVLAGGLAVAVAIPAASAGGSVTAELTYGLMGIAVALGAAIAKPLVPRHAAPLLTAASTVGASATSLVALSHVWELSDAAATAPLHPAVEVFLVVLVALATAWGTTVLLLRRDWPTREVAAQRTLLIVLLATLCAAALTAVTADVLWLDADLLYLLLAWLATVVGAALPDRMLTALGRGALATFSTVVLLSQLRIVLTGSPATEPDAAVRAGLLALIAVGSLVVIARTAASPRAVARIGALTGIVLALWAAADLLHGAAGMQTFAAMLQQAATPGIIALAAALLAPTLGAAWLTRADGIVLRLVALLTAAVGTLTTPGGPRGEVSDQLGSWSTATPLAVGLLALTAIIASIEPPTPAPAPRRLTWLRYGGVPLLAIALIAEVRSNWDDSATVLPFLGATAIFIAAGTAVALPGQRPGPRQVAPESLVWLASGPALWLSAGLLLDDAGERRGSIPWLEMSAAQLTFTLVPAALLAVSSFAAIHSRARPYVDALALGAAVPALLAGPVLSAAADDDVSQLAIGALGLAAALLVVVTAAKLLTRPPEALEASAAAGTAGTDRSPAEAGRPPVTSVAPWTRLLAASLVYAGLGSIAATGLVGSVRVSPDLAQAYALPAVLILCALAVCVLAWPALIPISRPDTRRVSPAVVPGIAIGLATLVAVVGLIVAATPQRLQLLELSTLPIAASVLVGGAILLRRHLSLRSWPALGPGLALLLLPSYLAQFGDPAPWRLIALGLLAVGVTVWGAMGRLQAPLVLGAIVAILHAVTAFRTALAAAAGVIPWWVWLALAGTLLVVLATTYEARLRDARRAASSIRALR